ncbi:hypothetical protein [Salinivibrio sp. VYel1]|uniref:hypothetical protein n=1 Tax=Salinivibrio sp. VYel1 TaxID=2490490 RepID=UPI00128C7D0F|nr:hypothetical protein [Salinivibrio sp. VYel1]MPX91049.1 hypothetical protein [Salinivibrio sp. VYel1]
MSYIPERSMRYKAAQRDYKRIISVVDAFYSKPDTTALDEQGITVVMPYTDTHRAMQLEAFGKRIDIRTSITFLQDHELLIESVAVYVPDAEGKNEQVLERTWFDTSGVREMPTSCSVSVSNEFYPALGFLIKSVDALLKLKEFRLVSKGATDWGALL